MEAMVVGVDTHKESHSAALLDGLGAVRDSIQVAAGRRGYRRLLGWARSASQQRYWVVEGTGSYGAGLAAFLARQGEQVFEGDRPKRPPQGATGKSDQLDAMRVAR